MWYKLAQHSLKEGEWTRRIRQAASESPYLRNLFDKYAVPFSDLKLLNVHIDNLNGKLAEVKDGDMWLDLTLFRDGDFINNWFHVVAQELPKWLATRSYKKVSQTDNGYVSSMAYVLSKGQIDIFGMEQKFLPLIRLSHKDYNKANKLFVEYLKLAKIELAKSKKG